MRRVAALLLWASSPACVADEPLHMNPFHDPFVQVTSAIACPQPRGPAYSTIEMRQEEHSRVERGTTCWLQGRCSEPNAYRYDARNAAAAREALLAAPELAQTAIWIVAERRFIYLQGCVGDAAQAARAEALMHTLPDVDIVIPMLSLPGEEPRYPVALKP